MSECVCVRVCVCEDGERVLCCVIGCWECVCLGQCVVYVMVIVCLQVSCCDWDAAKDAGLSCTV